MVPSFDPPLPALAPPPGVHELGPRRWSSLCRGPRPGSRIPTLGPLTAGRWRVSAIGASPAASLSSPLVAAYYHELVERLSTASANQHLSGIRQWLEWLTCAGVLPFNPATPVRTVRVCRMEGKTPVLDREEARRLFAALDASSALVDQRDRAILAVMLYDLVRVGAVVPLRVRDFCEHEKTSWLVLREKGGRQRRLPAHHIVREYIRGYLDAAGLGRREHAGAPLFQSSPGGATKLSQAARSLLRTLHRQAPVPAGRAPS